MCDDFMHTLSGVCAQINLLWGPERVSPGRYSQIGDPRTIWSFLSVKALCLLNLSYHIGRPQCSWWDNLFKLTLSTDSRQALCNVLHVASTRALSLNDKWFMIWASNSTGRVNNSNTILYDVLSEATSCTASSVLKPLDNCSLYKTKYGDLTRM